MCTKKELSACPVETTLTMISDKWKVLILRDLLTGTKRFGELKKSLTGVSQKVLTSQLREMEDHRFGGGHGLCAHRDQGSCGLPAHRSADLPRL